MSSAKHDTILWDLSIDPQLPIWDDLDRSGGSKEKKSRRRGLSTKPLLYQTGLSPWPTMIIQSLFSQPSRLLRPSTHPLVQAAAVTSSATPVPSGQTRAHDDVFLQPASDTTTCADQQTHDQTPL